MQCSLGAIREVAVTEVVSRQGGVGYQHTGACRPWPT
jgi:hypothetical protein